MAAFRIQLAFIIRDDEMNRATCMRRIVGSHVARDKPHATKASKRRASRRPE
jgi:hypothetical protein